MAAVLAVAAVAVGGLALLLDGSADGPRPEVNAVEAGAAQDSALVRVARSVVAFLRGEAGVDDVPFGDPVTLYMNPEGDVIERTLTRGQLLDRSNWTLRWGNGTYDLVPPATHTRVTLQPGRHFNCMESALAEHIPLLGGQPHVGVKLEPPDADSCLQTWNVTVVFSGDAARPQVVGVVYDQWEW